MEKAVEKLAKLLEEAKIALFIRIVGGLLLLLFSVLPVSLFISCLKGLFDPLMSEFLLYNIVGLIVSLPIVFVLFLLAYRAFTGKGRKEDGNFVSPGTYKICLHIFVLIGIARIVMAIYEN